MQDEAFKANHVALNMVRVRGGGSYNAFCLQRGANIGRNETKVLLKEEQASAEVNARLRHARLGNAGYYYRH